MLESKLVWRSFLWLKNLQMLCGGHISLMILIVKIFLERFTKKNCKKTNQKEFEIEKVINWKGDKLYVKWKRHSNSFNSWIDIKDAV